MTEKLSTVTINEAVFKPFTMFIRFESQGDIDDLYKSITGNDDFDEDNDFDDDEDDEDNGLLVSSFLNTLHERMTKTVKRMPENKRMLEKKTKKFKSSAGYEERKTRSCPTRNIGIIRIVEVIEDPPPPPVFTPFTIKIPFEHRDDVENMLEVLVRYKSEVTFYLITKMEEALIEQNKK
jgi:hypothetical protein